MSQPDLGRDRVAGLLAALDPYIGYAASIVAATSRFIENIMDIEGCRKSLDRLAERKIFEHQGTGLITSEGLYRYAVQNALDYLYLMSMATKVYSSDDEQVEIKLNEDFSPSRARYLLLPKNNYDYGMRQESRYDLVDKKIHNVTAKMVLEKLQRDEKIVENFKISNGVWKVTRGQQSNIVPTVLYEAVMGSTSVGVRQLQDIIDRMLALTQDIRLDTDKLADEVLKDFLKNFVENFQIMTKVKNSSEEYNLKYQKYEAWLKNEINIAAKYYDDQSLSPVFVMVSIHSISLKKTNFSDNEELKKLYDWLNSTIYNIHQSIFEDVRKIDYFPNFMKAVVSLWHDKDDRPCLIDRVTIASERDVTLRLIGRLYQKREVRSAGLFKRVDLHELK